MIPNFNVCVNEEEGYLLPTIASSSFMQKPTEKPLKVKCLHSGAGEPGNEAGHVVAILF